VRHRIDQKHALHLIVRHWFDDKRCARAVTSLFIQKSSQRVFIGDMFVKNFPKLFDRKKAVRYANHSFLFGKRVV
jgi:hypothetical protein